MEERERSPEMDAPEATDGFRTECASRSNRNI